jgi:hypothetical protein
MLYMRRWEALLCTIRCEVFLADIIPLDDKIEVAREKKATVRRDYIERLQGRGDPDCYWHNDEWLDAWRKWIDYQGSVDRYVKSKEFLRLIQEFKKP